MSNSPHAGSSQTFAFPIEKQKQIEQNMVAKQAAQAPFQRKMVMPSAPAPLPNTQLTSNSSQIPGVTLPMADFASIPNIMPGHTAPSSDPEGISLALPSKFAFYHFKDLYARPFRALHLAKLAKANSEGSLLQTLEVVSSVLTTTAPGCKNLAFNLTMPDFNFVLHWLRQESYTKSNFVHTTYCQNEEHIGKVRQNQMPLESLKITEVIRKGQLTVVDLDNLPDPEYFKFADDSSFYLTSATMRDAIEFSEAPQMQSDKPDEEFVYLAQMASYIQHKDYKTNPAAYWPLADRIKALETVDPDDIFLIQKFEAALRNYGVTEKIKITCKGCGASGETKVSLDAFSFLSSN